MRGSVTSIIVTNVRLKLYCVEVVDITYNIQYSRVNSLIHITFFITSKISGFEPMKQHMRKALLFCFNLKKSADESHRLLKEAYGEHDPTEITCRDWFRRFKSGDFDLKERSGQPEEFKDEDLEASLDDDRCHTLKQLSVTLKITKMAVSKLLHNLGLIHKARNWHHMN